MLVIGCQESTITTNESQTENDNTGHDNYLVEIAFPDVEGELITLGEGDYKVYVARKVVDGEVHYILGGDMILSEEQVELLRNRGSESAAGKETGIPGVQLEPDLSHSTFRTALNRLWPNGTIYYTLNNPPNPQRVLDAINHWNNDTNLTLLPRTNQSDYVEFTSTSSGCRANLGKQGGKQWVWLSSGCSTGNIIHEIGHAVGLFHEHQRSDRSNYITIHTHNIDLPSNDRTVNFGIYGGRSLTEGFEIGPLDFGSVMMYGPCFFSVNSPCNTNNATITRANGTLYTVQRNSLSSRDLDGVKYMYYPGVYVSIKRTLTHSWEDDYYPDYEKIYDAKVYFYSDPNRTQPKNLEYPIKFKFRDRINEQKRGEPTATFYNYSYTIDVPSGVSSWYLGEEKDMIFYDGPNIEYLYNNNFGYREGLGYYSP